MSRLKIYYARCPVPTASSIAFRKGFFHSGFDVSNYEIHELGELGHAFRNAHYDHSIINFFREGGGAPPIWARANGVDSLVLGITFMEELLGIYVRVDDPIDNLSELAWRRIAFPVWPELVFDFWRFAAEKGFYSALKIHGLSIKDVVPIDIVENNNSDEQRASIQSNSDFTCPGYHHQLQALLSREVDAIFAKGADAALLEREAQGHIKLLYDLRDSDDINNRINNSTPRLLTTSKQLWQDHPDAVINYLRAILKAAHWAQENPDETKEIIATECGISPPDVDRFFQNDYECDLIPTITPSLINNVEVMKSFLYQNGYITRDFSLDDWINVEPLVEAEKIESKK